MEQRADVGTYAGYRGPRETARRTGVCLTTMSMIVINNFPPAREPHFDTLATPHTNRAAFRTDVVGLYRERDGFGAGNAV